MAKKGSNVPEKAKTPQQLWYTHEKKAFLKTHADVSCATPLIHLRRVKTPCVTHFIVFPSPTYGESGTAISWEGPCDALPQRGLHLKLKLFQL